MNRCRNCNRFARWEELEYHEHKELGVYGDLIEHEWFIHAKGCPDA